MLAAGVVLFGPERERLLALLATVAPDVARTYAVVNGRIASELLVELRAQANLQLLECPVNFGVATALNLLVLAAALDGMTHIVLFDQDSAPSPGMVTRLSERFAALRRQGHHPAVVGPLMVSPAAGSAYKSPRVFARPSGGSDTGSAVAVDILATSGSLVDLDAFRRIGKFRDDYFIDAVDTEWSFRAWAHGYSCWIDRDLLMVHTVGEGEIRLGPIAMPRQKPFRMATYIRNSAYGLRLPHVPLRFKCRQGLYLPLQGLMFWVDAGLRPDVAVALLRAAWAGLRGRLGPPDGAPDV